MQKKGYSPHFAYKIFEKRFNDFFKDNEAPLKQKIWAHKRGFLSNHVSFFGLTEEDYKDYLPYFEYYKTHPINGFFSHWIDDKLTVKRILSPFSEYFPKYYFHLYKGEILRLSDCPNEYSPSNQGIFALLRQKETLAAKPLSGSFGQGFTKLGYVDGGYLLNNEEVQQADLQILLQDWIDQSNPGFIITEYLYAHSKLRKIWSETPNTIRISVLRNKYEPVKIINAYIRFGAEKTGLVDNTGAGGVCKINLESGAFNDGKLFTKKGLVDCKYHTDNGQLLAGTIPHWNLIKEKIHEISNYIPQVIYMGFDIVAIQDAFKIIEINSHEGIEFNQYYYPYMKHEPTKTFFTRLLNE